MPLSSTRSNDKMIKNYQLLKDLGKGYNAKVKLAINVLTSKYYAMKIFNT